MTEPVVALIERLEQMAKDCDNNAALLSQARNPAHQKYADWAADLRRACVILEPLAQGRVVDGRLISF